MIVGEQELFGAVWTRGEAQRDFFWTSNQLVEGYKRQQANESGGRFEISTKMGAFQNKVGKNTGNRLLGVSRKQRHHLQYCGPFFLESG